MLSRLTAPIKIYMITAAIAFAFVIMSGIGYWTVTSFSDSAHRISQTATEIRLGAQMNQDAVELNRAEYRIALDLDPVDKVRPLVAEYRKNLYSRLSEAEALAGAEQKAMLEEARTALGRYETQLDKTISLAGVYAGMTDINDGREELLTAVQQSHEAVTELRTQHLTICHLHR